MAKVNMNTRIWIVATLLAGALSNIIALCEPPARAQKSQPGTPKSNTDSILDKLKYPELAKRYKEYTEKDNKEMLLKVVERMLKLCDDAKELAKLTLQAGDLYFEKGYLTEAEQYYSEFSSIFQGNEKAEYASYKSIQCSFKRTYSFDRDQTKTEETIDMVNKFLERPSFKAYTKEVEEIRTECYKKIAEREIYVCDFYIKKGSLKACERRLDTIKSDWLPRVPGIAERVVMLEASVADLRKEKNVVIPTMSTVAAETVLLPEQNDQEKEQGIEVAAVASDKKRMADRF
jgi:outer membrane assembly lipoprotein YfiO